MVNGMTGVSEATRNAVWQEMLDVARLVRYYERMAGRQQRRRHAVRFVLLVPALTGMAMVVRDLPEAVHVVSGAVIAFFVAWDLLADPANKAAVLDSIRRDCSEAEGDLDALWGEIQADAVSDAEARRTLAGLSRRVARATDRAGSAHVPTNERLNAECEEAAFKVMKDRYAAG